MTQFLWWNLYDFTYDMRTKTWRCRKIRRRHLYNYGVKSRVYMIMSTRNHTAIKLKKTAEKIAEKLELTADAVNKKCTSLRTLYALTHKPNYYWPAHISSETRPSVQTLSDVCLKRICSLDTIVHSARKRFLRITALYKFTYSLNYLHTHGVRASIALLCRHGRTRRRLSASVTLHGATQRNSPGAYRTPRANSVRPERSTLCCTHLAFRVD